MSLAALLDGGETSATAQIQSILKAVRRHLAMDVGFVSEFVAGRRVFRFTDGETTLNPVVVGASDPLEKSFCHYVVRGLMPGLMQDAGADPVAASMPVTLELPVGAHLSVPLLDADGTPFGTLCCFSFKPDRSLTGRDLGILRLCADVVGAVMQKDRQAARDREAKSTRVARVIEGRLVTIASQPIYRTSDAGLAGFEALARFGTEPEVTPDVWFGNAAEVGLGEELEYLAAEKALEALDRIDPAHALAINLSPAAVLSARLPRLLAGRPLDRLVVELTEHATVQSYPRLIEALQPFRTDGLRLAVDDVGAGHSTFRHVLDLSPELIKLDISLIRTIDGDTARRALAEAITNYARRIGCEVVAEGVETPAEYAVLRDIGVTRVQGYLTGRPMPLPQALLLPRHASTIAEGAAA